MSCEHLEHWYEDCRNCQKDAWVCVDDMRSQRNDAHAAIAERDALIAELRAALVEAARVMSTCEACFADTFAYDALLERTKP